MCILLFKPTELNYSYEESEAMARIRRMPCEDAELLLASGGGLLRQYFIMIAGIALLVLSL